MVFTQYVNNVVTQDYTWGHFEGGVTESFVLFQEYDGLNFSYSFSAILLGCVVVNIFFSAYMDKYMLYYIGYYVLEWFRAL